VPCLISGAHVVLYSKDAEADREFFRKILAFPNVDAGEGWLIFALPPAELAVHPADENGPRELYLMCEDLKATTKALEEKKVKCSPPVDQGWGAHTMVELPGGGQLGLYQPKHPLARR
jgi:catechol 2,3-dioxygenase-like lactoylglutathione lyase family enzyme